MVDTIKLLIPIPKPELLKGNGFVPTVNELVSSSKYGKAVLNPSRTYAKTGKYMPRLTMFKRPSTFGTFYQLTVEFSAPKMLFGNNFDELTESDFEPLLKALQEKLDELIGVRYLKTQLSHFEVSSWHPSKNVVFLDYTSVQTLLNTIEKLDISRVYDVQKTDFRKGHVLHIHCNSMDIAFYDKMADLRKAKTSPKRAFESENQIQMNLFETFDEYKPMTVFRYEVRLVGKAAIKRSFPEIKQYNLENLFKKELCKGLLLKHWIGITKQVDMLSLDVNRPYELLQNYVEENEDVTPQAALAAVAGLLVARQEGMDGLRNVLEARFGTHAWYRIKAFLNPPNAYRFQSFQRIDEVLERFSPTYVGDYLQNIANN